MSTGAGAGRGHSSRDRNASRVSKSLASEESGHSICVQKSLSESTRRVRAELRGTSQAKLKTPEFILSTLGTCLWAFSRGGRCSHEMINHCLPSGSSDSPRTCFHWDGPCHLQHDTPLKSERIMTSGFNFTGLFKVPIVSFLYLSHN